MRSGNPDDRRSILIIENSPEVRGELVRVVRGLGGTPLEASTALHGLQLAAEHTPALILIGLGLPDLDGLTLCRVLKRDPAIAAIPLLAIGTVPAPGPPDLQSLSIDYLQRSASFSVLRDGVTEALKKSCDSRAAIRRDPSAKTEPRPPVARADRYPLQLPIRFTGFLPDARLEGEGSTHDVSLTGACLDLSDCLPSGTRLTIEFQKISQPLQLDATVVWAEKQRRVGGRTLRFRHGVRFMAMPLTQRRILEALLRSAAIPDRIGLIHSVGVLLRPDCDAELLDISLSGACICTYGKLPDILEPTLVLPDQLGALELPVRIVYSHPIGGLNGGLPEETLPCVTGLAFTAITFSQQVRLGESLRARARSSVRSRQ